MANLVVQDIDKIAVEQLLLGDKVVQISDCDGNIVDVHGLLANDLVVKTIDGTLIPLPQYVRQYAGDSPDVTDGTVTLNDGSTVTLKEIAEAVGDVEFTLAELEAKYNN